MEDLFSYAERYPLSPGFKEPGASRAAAEKMKPRAPTLRDMVLREIKAAGLRGLTADEAAAAIGKTEFAVRPRLTELYRLGLITKTKDRRPNASGVDATVWIAVVDA